MSNRKLQDDPILNRLLFARQYLDDPTHWRKGSAYGDKDGFPIIYVFEQIEFEKVAAACLLGAVEMPDYLEPHPRRYSRLPTHRSGVSIDCMEYIDKFSMEVHNGMVASVWNDKASRTHDEILEFLDTTIEHRKSQLTETNHDTTPTATGSARRVEQEVSLV